MESIKAESVLDLPMNYRNPETTIIATIARMNPPTPGHLLLIERMMIEAAQQGLTQISLILSHSVDSDENPLDCWTKRDVFLHASIQRFQEYLADKYERLAPNIRRINVVIVCMDDPFEEEVPEIHPKTTPILKALNYIFIRFYMYPRPDLTLKLFVGEDRDYRSFLGTSLRNKLVPIYFEQIQLERTNMTMYKSMNCSQLAGLDMESVPLAAMSASFVRNLVKCRLKEPFFHVMKKAFLQDNEIEELYQLLAEALPDTTSTSVSGGKYRKSKVRLHKYKSRKNITKKTKERKRMKQSKKYLKLRRAKRKSRK